jgi:hypothetical protein
MFFMNPRFSSDRNATVGVLYWAVAHLVGGFAALQAQTPSAAAYPTTPGASAGMTSGVPLVNAAQQRQMMQVRTAAQLAEGDAQLAAMARSAEESIEERNQRLALEQARETNALKKEMAERMKWERSSTAYNKVSANDMSTWQTGQGGVRVERDVPDAFIASLIEQEEQLAARQAEPAEPEGFHPLRSAGNLITRPFQGNGEREPKPEGESLLSKVNPMRLLPFGRGNDEPAPAAAPAPAPSSLSVGPTFAPTPVSARNVADTPPPTPAVAIKPGTVPRVSGASLVDGAAPVNQTIVGAPPASAPSVVVGGPSFSAAPPAEKKKFGLFSGSSKPDDSIPSQESEGGGLFGIGKKKTESGNGKIDASLFPDNAIASSPTGAPLASEFASSSAVKPTPSAAAPAPAPAPVAAAPSVELPGSENARSGGGLSLPKPNFSLPSLPSIGKPEAAPPALSTINKSGTDYYTVSSTAQFMVYGADPLQTEIRALQAGTLVRMTKPGAEWASIRLPDGTEGVVQVKNLAASASSGGMSFAPAN